MSRVLGIVSFVLFIAVPALPADPPAARSPREALQAFGDLIGTWRGSGSTSAPAGARPELWTEKIGWEWQFKGRDAWLKVAFEKSKHFTDGELRYVPDTDQFALSVRTPGKEAQTFVGPLRDKVLRLERMQNGEVHRLVFTFLHSGERFLYRYEIRPAGKALFAQKYKVGATKQGITFAGGDGRPECVVSGGLGTIPVTFQGKTYYVCCSGCRSEFNESPAKYVAEFEAKKAKKSK
jgi:Archaeal TRASH domain